MYPPCYVTGTVFLKVGTPLLSLPNVFPNIYVLESVDHYFIALIVEDGSGTRPRRLDEERTPRGADCIGNRETQNYQRHVFLTARVRYTNKNNVSLGQLIHAIEEIVGKYLSSLLESRTNMPSLERPILRAFATFRQHSTEHILERGHIGH